MENISSSTSTETQEDDVDQVSKQISELEILCQQAQELCSLPGSANNGSEIPNATHPQNVKNTPEDDSDTDDDFEMLEKPELDEILLWREEFLQLQPSDNKATDSTDLTECKKYASDLLDKFRRLQPDVQAMVLTGMSFVIVVMGYNSWPFISWAWPRLIAFATKFRLVAAGTWARTMVKSKAYKKILVAWKTGQPITPGLIRTLGPDFNRYVLAKGGSLLTPKT